MSWNGSRPEDTLDYDPEEETYRACFDGETVPPSVAVVSVIASITGTEPLRLDPLYETVDADALDRLLTDGHPEDDLAVTFTFHDHEVQVQNGEIEVRPPSADGM